MDRIRSCQAQSVSARRPQLAWLLRPLRPAAIWRDRSGEGQDVHVDLRKAFRRFSGFFEGVWETVNGRPPAPGFFEGNPFFTFPAFHETRDGRHVMALNFYPKLNRRTLNFLRC